MMKARIHAANRKRWDAAAQRWAERADSRGLWKRCAQNPELVLCERELGFLGDIAGKRVCVLGSGDNQVVFALSGLGALVTSVDISQNQLNIAEKRSKTLGLQISFVRSDVVDLSVLQQASFDAVYTGGHVAVWVADLVKYYAEAARILRPNGLFIVNEYHPFRRIWRESQKAKIVDSPYLQRGPFEYEMDEDILRPKAGSMKSYEFHWTIADYLNAILAAGCRLVFVDEYGERVDDWERAPMHGLPAFLLIAAQKES